MLTFRIQTEWRLVDGKKVIGCEDDSIMDRLSRIHTLNRVIRQSQFVDDPALIFNDNIIIEVFSTEMKPEMWITITPTRIVYESFGNI